MPLQTAYSMWHRSFEGYQPIYYAGTENGQIIDLPEDVSIEAYMMHRKMMDDEGMPCTIGNPRSAVW